MKTKGCICVLLLIVGVQAQYNDTQIVFSSEPSQHLTAQQIRDEANGYILGCAKTYQVGQYQLKLLQSPVKLSVMKAADNVKCFAKCVIFDSGFYHDNDFDINRVVVITVAQGKPEKIVRAMANRCRVLLEGVPDCPHMWEVYRCFHGSV